MDGWRAASKAGMKVASLVEWKVVKMADSSVALTVGSMAYLSDVMRAES